MSVPNVLTIVISIASLIVSFRVIVITNNIRKRQHDPKAPRA